MQENGYSSSNNVLLRGGGQALKKFLAKTSSPLDLLVKVRVQFPSPFKKLSGTRACVSTFTASISCLRGLVRRLRLAIELTEYCIPGRQNKSRAGEIETFFFHSRVVHYYFSRYVSIQSVFNLYWIFLKTHDGKSFIQIF